MNSDGMLKIEFVCQTKQGFCAVFRRHHCKDNTNFVPLDGEDWFNSNLSLYIHCIIVSGFIDALLKFVSSLFLSDRTRLLSGQELGQYYSFTKYLYF